MRKPRTNVAPPKRPKPPPPAVPIDLITLDPLDPVAILTYIARRVREARVNVVIAAGTPGAHRMIVDRGDSADKALSDVIDVISKTLRAISDNFASRECP